MRKKLCIIVALLAAVLPTLFMRDKICVSADGAAEIAMELESGTILYSKGEDLRLPMASTTKIMTAYIIAEECNLEEVISVPQEAVGIEGSSIYLKVGEQISVGDLLYGLMLRSGNDAAHALAVHHSGSVEKFVEKMNTVAKELKLRDTNFANPSGLPAKEHYTTARDLCNLARIALHNKVFADVVSTRHYNGKFRSFTNKNKLLSRLNGANGVKTGYTEKAGRCLVSSAKRGNFGVVCVVLNCYDMFERSEELIEAAYSRYNVNTIRADKVFYLDGKAFSLLKDCCVLCERGRKLSYSVCYESGKPYLKIYSGNDLIFQENLYNIR